MDLSELRTKYAEYKRQGLTGRMRYVETIAAIKKGHRPDIVPKTDPVATPEFAENLFKTST